VGRLVPAERAGERGPPAGDAGANGARRDLEHGGDLGVVEAELVAEHDRRPELLGEAGEGVVQDRAVDHRVVEARSPARCGVGLGRVGVEAGDRSAAPAPQLVEARVGGDPVAPGGEGAAAVEAREPPDDGDQRLLGGVVGIGVVPGEAAADGVDAVLVAAQERVEGAPIAGLGGLDERRIVRGRCDAGDGSGLSVPGRSRR
jgi:hypothetical protein